MPAFVKIGDIKGEATDQDHKDWIVVESLSSPIFRSIVQGAKDAQRTRGETTLGDISLTRQVDKSSPKLAEACANGTFFKDIVVEFCTTIKNKQDPYMRVEMANAIVSNYSFHGNASGDPLPTEEVGLNFTNIAWTYFEKDNETGAPKGQVVGKYDPGKGAS